MARIRTIKPEFFTSEDIVSLHPMARLLYVALWCEADREGRLQWKPRTFKMRYFPADQIDIDGLCKSLIDAGLVIKYGNGLAYIPSFTTHQHVNPREAASTLPAPNDNENTENSTRDPRVSTRESTVSDAQVGREGREGREGVESAQRSRGSRLPSDWSLTPEYLTAALETRPDWNEPTVRRVAESFRDYWISTTGRAGTKLDWLATWRNWCRNEKTRRLDEIGPKPSGSNNWGCPAGTSPMDLPENDPRRIAYATRGC